MTEKERRSLEAMYGSMSERRAEVQRQQRVNYRMSSGMKAKLQQEDAALERQISAISRRLADGQAADVLKAVERDRATSGERWAASMEARAEAAGRPATAA